MSSSAAAVCVNHFWAEEETSLLLQQLKHVNISKFLDGRKTRNGQVFKKVAKEMAGAGFSRTAEQVRVKWKRMKRLYYQTKKDSRRNLHIALLCPHYQLIEDLIGRPPASGSESLPEDQADPNEDSEGHPDNEDEALTIMEEEQTAGSSYLTHSPSYVCAPQRLTGRRAEVERFTSGMERIHGVLIEQLEQSQESQERLVNTILQSNQLMVSALLDAIHSLKPHPP
ncbi:uncharacterized protein LOC133660272 isoform X2 [Entelurus aequoreus]|uniref:uncharacterized protein LOC133660272 isoform X2 n=1 Tax=Entelurus aequoreus TaxID=161455 RepID=UPI002B1E2394|nr:uncharacterized protein LOC133660272 isoform X2 [Entelurus aequoreus]